MKQHTIEVNEHSDHNWIARCRCGWSPPLNKRYITRDMVMDEVRKHERQVERVRIASRRGSGTLRSDYEHSERMATNPNVPETDRVLWRQLADELKARLGTEPTPEEQPELDLLLATEE